jgi:hypothetical protein
MVCVVMWVLREPQVHLELRDLLDRLARFLDLRELRVPRDLRVFRALLDRQVRFRVPLDLLDLLDRPDLWDLLDLRVPPLDAISSLMANGIECKPRRWLQMDALTN